MVRMRDWNHPEDYRILSAVFTFRNRYGILWRTPVFCGSAAGVWQME